MAYPAKLSILYHQQYIPNQASNNHNIFGSQNPDSLEETFKFLGNLNFTTYYGREGLKNY